MGPDYVRPSIVVPAHFSEAESLWQPASAAPPDKRHDWWTVFNDKTLNELISKSHQANQTLAAAEASYRQALGALGSARASLFPTLGLQTSETRGYTPSTSGASSNVKTTDKLSLSSSWEIDLWGKIRRGSEVAEENAAASAADLAAAQLSIEASLVQSYLLLRVNDVQQDLLQRTLDAYRRTLEITHNRHEAGLASQAEVAQAETQLKTTEVQATDLGIQRRQLTHALAVFSGQLPGQLEIPIQPIAPALPALSSTLPSRVLEHRPDIAAAERRIAAANAQIGIAQSAYFPSLTLNATGGYQNSTWNQLLNAPNRFWSLGPSLALTLFDGGARSAQKQQAEANYDKTVAQYRQTVLTAFQEVEDNLAALKILAQETTQQASASQSANQFLTLTHHQYLAGTVSFLNVATAQAAALSAERALLDLHSRQLQASVALIKAVGGTQRDTPLFLKQ